jgi:hypothetical protein
MGRLWIRKSEHDRSGENEFLMCRPDPNFLEIENPMFVLPGIPITTFTDIIPNL